ncbi:hypothetical protein J2Z48_003119 [Croceifilum oryzae]|uniref:Uncharacterized protein n=1 Tax=Croceifilum oryzae TaxID=1553429 RepID=A0AAJ1TI24_9BACL|nr:hypothetical protein [Croceifilum oryzae]
MPTIVMADEFECFKYVVMNRLVYPEIIVLDRQDNTVYRV